MVDGAKGENEGSGIQGGYGRAVQAIIQTAVVDWQSE